MCDVQSKRPVRSALAQAIGARLHEIRIAQEVSQERLAEVAGITQGAVSLYERGARDIRVVDLLAFLDHFDVGLTEFMAEVPEFFVLEDSADIELATKLIADGLDGPVE